MIFRLKPIHHLSTAKFHAERPSSNLCDLDCKHSKAIKPSMNNCNTGAAKLNVTIWLQCGILLIYLLHPSIVVMGCFEAVFIIHGAVEELSIH